MCREKIGLSPYYFKAKIALTKRAILQWAWRVLMLEADLRLRFTKHVNKGANLQS